MSNQDNNIQIVKEIYDAVGQGDVDAILERVSDDVDWAAEAAGSAAPWYGPRAGKAGVASFFNDINSSIEILKFAPRSFAAGDAGPHAHRATTPGSPLPRGVGQTNGSHGHGLPLP